MAIPKIKATYSLDAATVRLLERMARRWAVSKSEALGRAIRASASLPDSRDEPLQLLRRMQADAGIDPAAAKAWASEVRAERRATNRPTPRRK